MKQNKTSFRVVSFDCGHKLRHNSPELYCKKYEIENFVVSLFLWHFGSFIPFNMKAREIRTHFTYEIFNFLLLCNNFIELSEKNNYQVF
jgi:hypothetical protein